MPDLTAAPEDIDYDEKEKLINHAEILADGVRYSVFSGIFSGNGDRTAAGIHHLPAVPMVRRGDDDGIQVVALQEFPVIAVQVGTFPRAFFQVGDSHSFAVNIVVHIAPPLLLPSAFSVTEIYSLSFSGFFVHSILAVNKDFAAENSGSPDDNKNNRHD